MPRRLSTAPGREPFPNGAPPRFASAWGIDGYGAYVAFTFQEVETRLRWIPPGSFMMGAPERERGRYDDEGPRRRVTIAEAFWLMETPVTQGLWQAVMGDNPSRFKGPMRPVEHVSFQDAGRFIAILNGSIEGLHLELPSEALWEYACRAGSKAARYDAIDKIAWFDENSLKQTHDVAMKRPNAWGLYDLLGNVGEWCLDKEHRYTAAPQDGGAWLEPKARNRVMRGGAWSYPERTVRAAFRFYASDSYRDDIVGFRCARLRA